MKRAGKRRMDELRVEVCAKECLKKKLARSKLNEMGRSCGQNGT